MVWNGVLLPSATFGTGLKVIQWATYGKFSIYFFLITGLDPARPLFAGADTIFRLDPGDAEYVDAVHTSEVGIGAYITVGHTDFYPNGGFDQPGCDLLGKNLLLLICSV